MLLTSKYKKDSGHAIWVGCIISSGTGQLFWVAKVDKNWLPGCGNESLYRLHMQNPSAGLSWPLALTVSNGGLAFDQSIAKLGSWSLAFHQARVGRMLPGATRRSHRPYHFPILGWQLQRQGAWGRHTALPCRKDSQQLCLCGEGEGKPQMSCLWMSHSCKYPLHMMLWWPVQDKSGDMSWCAECFWLKTLFLKLFVWVFHLHVNAMKDLNTKRLNNIEFYWKLDLIQQVFQEVKLKWIKCFKNTVMCFRYSFLHILISWFIANVDTDSQKF